MNDMKEFLETRMIRFGFSGPTEFCRVVGVTYPTYLRLVTTGHSRARTRGKIAMALHFRDWPDVIAAFDARDVAWMPPATPPPVLRAPPVPMDKPRLYPLRSAHA